MAYEIGTFFGATAWIVMAVLWVALLVAMVLLPFAMLSMTRNVRRIRVQLERLNDTLESRGRGSGGSVLGI